MSWIDIGLDQNGFMDYPIQPGFSQVIYNSSLFFFLFLASELFDLSSTQTPLTSITTWITPFGSLILGHWSQHYNVTFVVSQSILFFNSAFWVIDFVDLWSIEVYFMGLIWSINELVSLEETPLTLSYFRSIEAWYLTLIASFL